MSEWQETDIGLIPIDWSYAPFGTVLAEPTRNGIYKTKEYHGRGTKVINMGELFSYEYIGDVETQKVELTEQEFKKSILLTGDLIFARRSLVAEGAGKCSLIIDHDEPMTFESSIIRARPNKNRVSSEYLFYLFKSRVGRYLMGTILRQVAVSGITASDLVQLKIPIPPLDEQRRIAAVISPLDAKIDLLRRQNHTLEQIAQTLFNRWFVEFEFPNEQGQHYQSSGGPMVESELGEIPLGWRVGTFGKEIEAVKGLSYKGDGLSDKGVPMHNLKSVFEGGGYQHSGIKFYTAEFKDRHICKAGDIIIPNTEQGERHKLIGFPARIPASYREISIFTHHLFRVRPLKSSHLTNEYLYYLFMSGLMRHQLLSYTNGTTVDIIGNKNRIV